MQRDHMRRIASGILLILALMLMQGIMAVPQASAAASAQLNYGAADLVFVMGMNSELKNKDGSFSRYDAAALIAGMCDPETSRAAILKAFYDGTLTTWPIPDQGEFKALKDGGLAELHAELSRMRTFNYYGKSVNLTDGVNQGLRMLLGRKNPAAAPVMLIIADAYSTLDMEKTSRVLTQASGSECTVHVMYLENGPDGETRGYLERVASDTDGHFLLIRSANEFTGKALDIMTEKLRGGRVSFSNDVVVRAGGQTETLITLKSAVASSVYVYVDKLMEAMGQASLFDVKLLPVSGRPGMPSQKAKQIYDGNACALFEVNSSLPGMEWVLSAGSSREIARGELRVVALYDQSGLQLQAGLNEQEKITVSKDEEFILGAAIAADGAILPPRQYGDVGMRAEIWPSQSVPGRTDTIRIDLNRKDGSYEARLCFNDLGLTKPGEYSVQVTAEGEGVRLASSVLTFNAVNKAPVPVREGDASLQIIHPSITSILQEDAKSITIDVAELFDSPDGDELTYDLKTSGGALVNCVLDTNILTVTANRVVGSTVITITATDLLHNDAQCEASVKVNVSALPLVQGLMKYAEIRLEMDNTTFLPGEEMVMNVFLENRYFRGERFSTRDCYEAILDGVQLSVRDSSGAVSGIIHHIPEGTPCFRGAHRIAAGPDTYVFSAGAVIGGNTLPSRSTQPYKVRAPISFVIHSQAARFGGPGEKRTVSLSESFEADELEYDYFLDDKTLLRITQDEYMLTLEPRGRAGREVITVKARDKVSGIEQFACIPVDISMKPLSESLGGLARLEMKVESLDRMLAEPDMIECTVRLVNREGGIPYTDPECYRAVGAENLSLTATTGGAPESFDLVLSPEGTYFTGTYSLKGAPGTYIFKAAGASGGKRFEEVQHTLRVHPKVLLRMEHPLAGYTGEYPKDVLNFVQDAALPEGMETAYDPQPMKPDLLRLELMGSVLTIQAVGTEGFTQVHVFRTSEGVTRLAAIIPVEIAFKPLSESLGGLARLEMKVESLDRMLAEPDMIECTVRLVNREGGIPYTDPECYRAVGAENLSLTATTGGAPESFDLVLSPEGTYFTGTYSLKGAPGTYIFKAAGASGGKRFEEVQHTLRVHPKVLLRMEHPLAGYTGEYPKDVLNFVQDAALPEGMETAYDPQPMKPDLLRLELMGSVLTIQAVGTEGFTQVHVFRTSEGVTRLAAIIPVEIAFKPLGESLSAFAEFDLFIAPANKTTAMIDRLDYQVYLRNEKGIRYTNPACYAEVEGLAVTVQPSGSAVRATSPELRSEPSMFEGSFNTGGEKNTYIFTVSGKIGGIDLTEKKQLCKVSDEQIIHIEHQMAGDTEPRKILEIRYDEVLENPEKKDLVYSAEADRTLVSFEALEGSHDGFRIMSRGHDGSTLVTVTGESGDGWKSVTVIPVTVKQNSLAASLSTSAEPAILLPAGPQPKDRDSKVGFSMALKNKRNNTVYTDPECYQAIEEAIITLTRTGPLGDVNPQVLQWAYRGNKGEFIVKSDPYQDGAMLADVSMGPSGVSGTVITGRKSGHYSLTCSVSINGKWIEGINAAFYVQNSPPKPADEAVNLTFTIPPGRIPEDWLLMADVLHGFLAGTPVEHGTTLEPSKYFSDPDAHDVLRYSVSGVSGGDGSPIAYEQGSMNLKFLGEGVGTIYLNAEDSDGSMATKGINILLTSASVLAWKTILVCSLIILAALFVLWMLVRLVVWPFKPSWKQNRDLEVFVNELYEGAVVMPALGKKPLRYRVKDRKMIAGDAVASKSENPFIKILEAAPLVNSDAKPALRSVLKGMTFTPGNKQSLIIKPGSVRRGQLPESGDVEFYINNKQKGRGKRIRFRRGEFKAAYKQGGKILGSVSFLFANDSLSRRNSRV